MSSANRLDPKTPPTDAWKQWHRDSVRMWKRVGLFWQVGFIVLTAGASTLCAQLVQAHPMMGLVAVPLMMTLGFAMIPTQFRALERARRGEDADLVADLTLGLSETLANPKWLGRGVGIAMAWVAGIMLIVALASLGGRSDDPKTPERVITTLDVAAALIVYGTLYLWALKPRGFLGLDYFLEIREGLDHQHAKALETLAGGRNAPLMLMASLSLAMGAIAMITLVAIITSNSNYAWLSLVAFPLLTWHCAGMSLCAWHDIFDPDGGLAERQKAVALQPAHILSA